MKLSSLHCPKLAWVQITATDDVANNLAAIELALTELASRAPDIVVLPEAFAWLSPALMEQTAIIESLGDVNAPLQAQCRLWARTMQAYLVAGSLPLRIGQQVYATLCVFNPQGELVTYYRKMHLFSVTTPSGMTYHENRLFHEGPVPVIWQSPWGSIGLAICYDLRFPAMFRYYAQHGVRLILIPAAFTLETGHAHWHTLVRARAIENQCVMLAVNQVGQHAATMASYGHSLLVNAWGQIVCDSGDTQAVGCASIDLTEVDQLRQQFPVLAVRQNGLDS